MQLMVPSLWVVRVHEDDEPEKNVVALPLNTTGPVGGAVEAESPTVAVQLLGLPGVTNIGMQFTIVLVGSINASTATAIGPPGSLTKLGWRLVALLVPRSARPIVSVL